MTNVHTVNKQVYHQKNTYCLYDQSIISDFTPKLLSSDYWQQQQAIAGTAQGRGTTWFILPKTVKQQWVLKHYYRGGLIGKINRDSYWFSGFEHTRAIREFNLLIKLQELNLPAPTPIACRVKRRTLTYQADILTNRINHSQDIVDLLQQQSLSHDIWQKVGATIQRFHQAGIYHDDLNCHNILLDQQEKVWLIDFDRGEQRPVNQNWQKANLDRLLRSFHKEARRLSPFHWHPDNWRSLLTGYLS